MLSRILKVKQKLGVTFNSDKQNFIDFTKFSKTTMQGLSSKFKKVVLYPLLFGQNIYKGLLIYQQIKEIQSSNTIWKNLMRSFNQFHRKIGPIIDKI